MKVEVREDKVIIDGYVNAVDRFSKVLHDKRGEFIEKIMPSVFRRALEKNDAVKVLLDHDYDRELANTSDGTAKLYEDNIGLRATVEITDAEVIEKAKVNKLRGWSFGFFCNKEDETVNSDGLRERSVRDIDLLEVSILDDRKTPAYIGTSIELRNNETRVIEYRTEEFEDVTDESQENIEDSPSMTASQIHETLNNAFMSIYPNGWLEDYDDKYVYGIVDETRQVYKMRYSISDGTVTISNDSLIKVIRGGYKEVRNNNEPEQPPDGEKINYSRYEVILNKIKGGI